MDTAVVMPYILIQLHTSNEAATKKLDKRGRHPRSVGLYKLATNPTRFIKRFNPRCLLALYTIRSPFRIVPIPLFMLFYRLLPFEVDAVDAGSWKTFGSCFFEHVFQLLVDAGPLEICRAGVVDQPVAGGSVDRGGDGGAIEGAEDDLFAESLRSELGYRVHPRENLHSVRLPY